MQGSVTLLGLQSVLQLADLGSRRSLLSLKAASDP
jgi:hypothetical protein